LPRCKGEGRWCYLCLVAVAVVDVDVDVNRLMGKSRFFFLLESWWLLRESKWVMEMNWDAFVLFVSSYCVRPLCGHGIRIGMQIDMSCGDGPG
jgi:hypothetical protein